MSRIGTLWIALVATFVTYPIASAATYTVTDLGTLGGTRSYAAGINARGDIVGWSTLAGDSAAHAFLYQSRHGRMIDLDPRGAGGSSAAWGINDRGRIAGDIGVGVGSHVTLFVRGRIIDLGTPPGVPSAFPLAINHADDILIQGGLVGTASRQGFLLHHGHFVVLPITDIWGLNDRRQVVGSVGLPAFQQAVVFSGNALTGVPGLVPGLGSRLNSLATAINARGDIAGGYQDGSTGGAFLERGGVLTDLYRGPRAEVDTSVLVKWDQEIG